ncbi:outer membrane protein assembly factor BamA [Geomonas sp. RF6]|uniref:outer membrane protein assembly factor BamA n=1 Tax=Geomonas sp. RF6 TaxID=2897342 RepID=UPI001E361171|nr:outer membrane protein assembly factor BamA [Geomonas sp. RF6]UFS68629.1 outer membrane protein assembly factor BamA [Geomonas sp. RF6]
MQLVGLSSRAMAENEKITAVKVTGNRRIEAAAILQVVREKAGDQLDVETVDADIRAIYRLGHFRDVKAEVDRSDAGVTLNYVVQEKPVVRGIRIEGAKELSTEKVRDALEIKANTIFSQKDLTKSIQKVKKLYMDEGYYLAEINAVQEKRSETELDLVFKITEGQKILITKIEFEGNKAFPAKKLKKTMETSEKWFLSWLTSAGTYKEEQLKNDAALISDLYLNNGFVNVKVGEPKVELLPDKSGLKVTIGITEGERYRIGAIDFGGDVTDRKELEKVVTEKPGQVFSRANLRTDIFALTDVYADKGFAFANVSPATKLNPEKHTIDITFEMEKGEKVYIDRINVTGNSKTRDKVVRREMKLAEGDLYSSSALKRSKQSLMNLGFFEEANIANARGSADNKLDLNVDVKEKATGTFSIGAGYSSLDGLIGQGSVSQANFLGLGLKATLAGSIGSKSQTYNVGLTDPYFLDTKWTLGGDIYRTERDYLDYTRRATGADIKAGYPLSDTLSTFWMYKYEKKDIFDLSQPLQDNITRGVIEQFETSGSTSSITASLTSNTTDYHVDPSRGWVNSLNIEVAGLGGSSRFARYVTDNTLFFPVGFGTVGSIKTSLGYIQGIGKDVPIDERFYLGGISTLRGYESRTVCPVRPGGVPGEDVDARNRVSDTKVYLGANAEAVVNLEWQFPLLKEANLKGVVFMDAGNADNTINAVFSKFLMSYGFGIRWFSPVGPLRLEYGIPINPRPGIDKTSGRLEFSIGNFF